MREPTKEKHEIDLTKPVDPEGATDCFGREWKPSDASCKVCADLDICGIKYQAEVKKRVKEFDKTLPLDLTAFEKINFTKMVKMIRKYSDDPLTYEELADLVAQQARTKDMETVKAYLRRQFPSHNIIVSENKLYINDVQTITDKAREYPVTEQDTFGGN